MIKKCTGCGITLQTEDINKEGYTENIDNELCLRCFKLKNYGEYKAVTLNNKGSCRGGGRRAWSGRTI